MPTTSAVSVNSLAVIGLGYVGLPLAVQFAERYRVVGFDINPERVHALRGGVDATSEVSPERLQAAASRLVFTTEAVDMASCDFYVVAVPTPITASKEPDLGPLAAACKTVGSVISPGDTIVFESTVYPGCTEEFCTPILENESGLKVNKGFYVGYSPERINPGDPVHTVDKITKVTSGSTEGAAQNIDAVYASVITAGTYRAPSIRVAEAAKAIENAQRDLNIAFMNELSTMFDRLNLDTADVLDAAGTKWNFLPFRPGLVGGHCIGVDPYYLTYKARQVGYYPEVILAGRRMNDGMGAYVAAGLVKLMLRKGIDVARSRVLVLGITFKENCRDTRNTRVVDIVRELGQYGCGVSVYDPWADAAEVRREYGIDLLPTLNTLSPHQGCILAVAHRQFLELSPRRLVGDAGVVYDVKSVWPRDQVDKRL